MDGIVAGRVSSGLHRYAVEPFRAPSIQLGLVNSGFWQTHPGDRAGEKHNSADMAHPSPDASTAATFANSSRGFPNNWDPACPGSPPSGQYVIDILLLYTQGILTRYSFNPSSVHAALQTALDDANQALRNGGIQNVRFSPRGPEFLPYPIPTFSYYLLPISFVLHHIAGIQEAPPPTHYTFPGNPYVAARRDAMWADIVAVARADQNVPPSCGYSIANRLVFDEDEDYPREPGPDFEKFAYIIFDPECGADRLNLAHELGHQLGLEHDSANYAVPGALPSCPWSFAHKRSTGDARFRFRTVTAYWQNIYGQPGPGDCGSDTNYPLIDSYSTPLLEWAGDPGTGGPT